MVPRPHFQSTDPCGTAGIGVLIPVTAPQESVRISNWTPDPESGAIYHAIRKGSEHQRHSCLL